MSLPARLPYGPPHPKTWATAAFLWRTSWHHRWQQFYKSRRAVLHRVAAVERRNDLWCEITGTTVCGRRGEMHMPGIFSRMGAPRCKRCCALLGVRPGEGAPYNDKSLPKVEKEA